MTESRRMRIAIMLTTASMGAAACPAASAAAPLGGIIYTGAVQVRAYKMTVLAVTRSPHSGPLVAISFTRGGTSDEQQHYYQFTKNVRVNLSATGASGSIRATLGAFGRIDLRFAAGGGRGITSACKGSRLLQRTGRLTGAFHFTSGSSYFRTIDLRSLRAASAIGKKGFSCKPPSHSQAHGTQLDVTSVSIPTPSAGAPGGASLEDFSAVRDRRGHVIEQFLSIDSSQARNGIVITRAIDRSGLPPSALTNAPDLSSAAAVASGQFLRGGVRFRAARRSSRDSASGTITGNITARFDGLEAISIRQTPTTECVLTTD